MQISIQARGVKRSDRFETYVEQKADKIAQLSDRAQTFEVKVTNVSDKKPSLGERVELTVVAPGPVVRAESEGGDRFSAFDLALGKLTERLRRSKDRRKPAKGRPAPSLADIAAATADLPVADEAELAGTPTPAQLAAEQAEHGEVISPVVVRHKEVPAERITAEEAVDQMELVGHDFYLFEDVETGKASVVYRRKGWNYGVIRLGDPEDD